MEIRWRDFPHIFESQQFSRQNLEDIFKVTDLMAKLAPRRGLELLAGYRALLYFWEPSTRTQTSFAVAIARLGGVVEFSTPDANIFSSAAKGESLRDTIKVLAGYFPDFIVMRHKEAGAAEKAVEILKKPLIVNPYPPAIINAGDGPGQHPTQSILDLYTIRQFSQIDGIKIAFVGDLENSRVARSDCYLLSKFEGVEICFCSPRVVRMRDDIKNHLKKHRVRFWETPSLREAMNWADFIQDTRVQTERFEKNPEKLQQAMIGQSRLIITKKKVRQFKDGQFLAHPMPRIIEISQEIDDDSYPKNVIFLRQSQFGLFTRMAEVYIIRREGQVDLKRLKKLAS